METLKNNSYSSDALAKALRINGKSHKNYKIYTSMERALGLLLSGSLFLSDGSKWNDTKDRETMKNKGTFATCLSWSTSENVAMWMLYGDENGKKGAMLNLYPSTMKDLLGSRTIELGRFDNSTGKYESVYTLSKGIDFEIFATDILYIEECANNRVRVTVGDEHIVTNLSILGAEDIYYKNYPWAYERECRLVVKLTDNWKMRLQQEGLSCIRVTISESELRKLRKNRLIRSPIYENGTDYGFPSKLTGEVCWNI